MVRRRQMGAEMDYGRLAIVNSPDFVDIVGNFVEPDRSVVVEMRCDQKLDSVEILANYSTVDSLAVDDLDCQISGLGRCHDLLRTCSTDCMRSDYSCCYYHFDQPVCCLAMDSNCHLRHKIKQAKREMRSIVIQ